VLVLDGDISGSCYVLVQGCGFCKRGFISYDAAIASYKHTYHPFCLAQLSKEDNKCHVCKEVFHPKWWASWGIQEPNDEIMALAIELGVDDLCNTLKLALKEECATQRKSCNFLNYQFFLHYQQMFKFTSMDYATCII
jgi:hypothetical protein